MSADSNVAPVIIKKVKKVSGGGHHGGAWKVAYADFVTAMMAFFLLMWLLSSSSETQKSAIADYFSPTIAIARTSGGGDGMFNGDSIFTEETLAHNGQGATMLNPINADAASGSDDDDGEKEIAELQKTVDEALFGTGGESMVEENALEHIITRVTDEGLVIELFSIDGQELFEANSADPTPLLVDLARVINGVTRAVINEVAVEGHVAAEPVVLAQSAMWALSAARADAMRELLANNGMPDARLRRVTGHADRENAVANPMHIRNDRLEIILLRDLPN